MQHGIHPVSEYKKKPNPLHERRPLDFYIQYMLAHLMTKAILEPSGYFSSWLLTHDPAPRLSDGSI